MLGQFATECSPSWTHWITYGDADKKRCEKLYNLLDWHSQNLLKETKGELQFGEHVQYKPYYEYWLSKIAG
jgi:hypothetical protein